MNLEHFIWGAIFAVPIVIILRKIPLAPSLRAIMRGDAESDMDTALPVYHSGDSCPHCHEHRLVFTPLEMTTQSLLPKSSFWNEVSCPRCGVLTQQLTKEGERK
jgi:hypothetical protein